MIEYWNKTTWVKITKQYFAWKYHITILWVKIMKRYFQWIKIENILSQKYNELFWVQNFEKSVWGD